MHRALSPGSDCNTSCWWCGVHRWLHLRHLSPDPAPSPLPAICPMVTCLVTTGATPMCRGVLTSHCYCPETRIQGMGDECGNGSQYHGHCVTSYGGVAVWESECDTAPWAGSGSVAGSDKTWPRHKLLQAVTGMCRPRTSHQCSVTNCSEMHRLTISRVGP